jgi:hypothetical protein
MTTQLPLASWGGSATNTDRPFFHLAWPDRVGYARIPTEPPGPLVAVVGVFFVCELRDGAILRYFAAGAYEGRY